MTEPRDVVVVGAGVGGLATAVRMAARGHRVTVLEAASTVGGKLGEHVDAGHRFDRGPSLFTMPELMEELDALVPHDVPGRPAPFAYRTLDRSTHYFWEDEEKPLVRGPIPRALPRTLKLAGACLRSGSRGIWKRAVQPLN